jgi:DNA ligase D-like protein (predicted 3'-phosphoesterase)
MAKDALKEYQEKRCFTKTAEPAGGTRQPSAEPIFVVQKHAARRLHYDFRLEVEGVLKSWAVPKGPSRNPGDKRLAVPTEDHPLEYADFEGVIPEGEYGGGTVMIWDTGTYRNLTEKKGTPLGMAEALEHGHAVVRLEGRKLKGAFALTRFKKAPDESWLLVKKADEHAEAGGDILQEAPDSAVSGRGLEEIARGAEGAS